MQDKITLKIETSVIGTELTNTVDARELHKNLGVRKDFSNWIKGQITNLGLEEGFDFITLALKGVGGKFDRIDYTLTLDTAKHISMASRTQRGKEVRNYFIEAEKKLTQIGEAYRAQPQNQTIDLSPIYAIMEAQTRILEHISVQNTLMLTMVERLPALEEDLYWNTRWMLSRTGAIMYNLDKRSHISINPNECSIVDRVTINDRQRSEISVLVSERSRCLSECYGIQPNIISTALYVGMKSRFGVMYYGAISASDYDDAVRFIENFEIGR